MVVMHLIQVEVYIMLVSCFPVFLPDYLSIDLPTYLLTYLLTYSLARYFTARK